VSAATGDKYEWLGLPLKSLVAILIGVVLLGLYIGVLLFGENSIPVLNKLKNEENYLNKKRQEIKISNQKLQKEYFELLQLSE